MEERDWFQKHDKEIQKIKNELKNLQQDKRIQKLYKKFKKRKHNRT